MGGHALKTIETKRYGKKKFEKISESVITRLRFLFPNNRISSIPYLKQKKTFGDLDVLISHVGYLEPTWIIEIVKEEFKPKEFFQNGLVFTFHVDDFQVDLIFTSEHEFDMAKIYYSWNDAGMLIGRLTHSLGFKYGPSGLNLYVYSDDNSVRLAHFILTNDAKKIFEILDLDLDRYLQGFNNYNELFEFLSHSKYFFYDVFDSSLIRSADRRRDNKRKSLHIFKDWLELNQESFPRHFERLTKEQAIKLANELFPEQNIMTTIEKIKEGERIKKLVSEKWNGHIIKERYTELSGKDLGIALMKFHKYGYKYHESLENFILENGIEIIFQAFDETIKKNYEDI